MIQLPPRRTHGPDLRAGEWVVVKSKEEILATLDERGQLDRLPFQPEMFAFCGRRLRVFKIAHKTCDTIHKTGGRKMNDTVHLEAGRCNGSAHGGCQADCLFFWKTAWLRRDDGGIPAPDAPGFVFSACTEEAVERAARKPGDASEPVWSCQATALFEATEPLKWWDLRQYVQDVTSGNHSAWHMFKLLAAGAYRRLVELGIGYRLLIGLYNAFQKVRGGRPFPVGDGTIGKGQATPHERLDLRPGEWVEVRTGDEIRATINADGFNRGMRFDKEMLMYCRNRYRVRQRVERLINERTGEMMQMKTPCIELEDVYCRAECSEMRLGCPRALPPYWREIWLRRVDGEQGVPKPGS